MSTPKPYACRHIFTDGHQCGSPALRGEPLCFYHHASRLPQTHQTIHGHTFIALPEPLDLHAVQRGLAEVLRLAATGTLEPRLAAVLLRTLALASQNLARIDRQTAALQKANPSRQVTDDYVVDPNLGTLAPEPKDQPAPEPRPEGPLPAPASRFTLTPLLENCLSQKEYDESRDIYAQALRNAAAAIDRRAAQRARLHASLHPLIDDTSADQRFLEDHPELTPYLKQNQEFGSQQQTPEPAAEAA